MTTQVLTTYIISGSGQLPDNCQLTINQNVTEIRSMVRPENKYNLWTRIWRGRGTFKGAHCIKLNFGRCSK